MAMRGLLGRSFLSTLILAGLAASGGFAAGSSSTSAAATYTVTYKGNGNTGGAPPTDSAKYATGAKVAVKGNTGNLARAGYSFNGWNTTANGSGTAYAAGATFTMGSANVTLYANWKLLPTYTITYAGNGNTGGAPPTDSSKYATGAKVTVKGNTGNLARAGYSFNGWNTAVNGTGTAYAVGATLTMGGANVTLYANWKLLPTYTITYKGNGNTSGAPPTDSGKYATGAKVTVKGNTGNLARAGYSFSGWNTAANRTGTAYAAGFFPRKSQFLGRQAFKPEYTGISLLGQSGGDPISL